MTAATECGFEILPQPTYSPDMAPSDFHLFPKLVSHLRGTQYESNEGPKEAVNEYLGDQENAFYFEGISSNRDKLEQRWSKCIALKGDYIDFVLLDLILYVPSTIFQLYRDGSSWVEPVLS